MCIHVHRDQNQNGKEGEEAHGEPTHLFLFAVLLSPLTLKQVRPFQ